MSLLMLLFVPSPSRIARALLGGTNPAHALYMRIGAFDGGVAGERPSKRAKDTRLRIMVAWALFAAAAKAFTGTCGTAPGGAAARPQGRR